MANLKVFLFESQYCEGLCFWAKWAKYPHHNQCLFVCRDHI